MNDHEEQPNLEDDGQADDGECVSNENEEVYVDKAEEDGGLADDEGNGTKQPHLAVKRRRKPSERILKKKLKNVVFDKDGGGMSAANPVSLE